MEEERSFEGYGNTAADQGWLIRDLTGQPADLVKAGRGRRKGDSCFESDS